MKRLTSLVVITLFVLGCSAAFGQNTKGGVVLGFLASDGVTQYCDYEAYLDVPLPYAAGIHVLRFCDLPYDGTTIGFKGNLPASTGLPVTGGEIYMLADNVLDASCDCDSGDQVIWVTRTSAVNPKVPTFGWEYFYNTQDAFDEYLGNFGYLTNNIPTYGLPDNGPAGKRVSSFQGATRNNNMMTR